KKEVIARTERSLLSKSHFLKTSVKKLMLLARQIAGKDIDDAIVQMRFSKKAAAREVLAHLKHAKNEAIARSGMGLSPNSPYIRQVLEEEANPKGEEEDGDPNEPLGEKSRAENPKRIWKTPETPMWRPKDKNPDPTRIYIAETWVGRGPF